jgi:hypothetical protein
MKVSNDMKERLKIGALWVFQSYKVIMGSLLILFVPQKCEELVEYSGSSADDSTEYESAICSVSDNLHKTDDMFHNVTLGFNFLCVGLFLITYVVELRRENWCVKNFDINHDFPDNHLDDIIDQKPELKAELYKRNNRYFKITSVTSSVYMINLILSSIIIYDNYVGIQAVTSYTSYVALILLKIYNSLSISYSSLKGEKALSGYITEFSSFNVFDEDIIVQDDPKEIKLEKQVEELQLDGIDNNDINLTVNP